ncbi:MAG: aminotransferase class V-fold PLP-dependent enzyme [Gammaproteobacteria bacterium]|nr:aminotransferase class V-fold PLP-dependent enzyme [Gammaproteobacteria bacterium]
MTLRFGRELLAMPGPTTIPDVVLGAMHRPAIDIYAGELVGITDSCLSDLKRVFKTRGQVYVYISNGHGAWEAAVSNTLSRGDRVLVLESGRFALGWAGMAESMGVQVQVLPGDWRRAVDPNAVEQALREDAAHRIKAVMVVQIDTASGCVNDIPAIRAAMDAAGHPALLMVDTIASLATMPFEMDEWRVDVAVCGSQKGLMMPPGLGFVAASARARAAYADADLKSRYWDWAEREGSEHYQKYCGTPPEHMLFGLRRALDLLFEEGLDAAIERHRLLAGAVRAAVERWQRRGAFEFNILEASQRANSVTTVRMREGHDPAPIVEFCKTRCGLVLGIGIGGLSGKAFRIAHMGHTNAPMVLGGLASIEVGLNALGVGSADGAVDGVQAATAYLGEQLGRTLAR